MSLSVYVMPVWKFKCGDFSSPVERLGLRPKTVSFDGRITERRRPGFVERWYARRATRRLRREVGTELGRSVRWNDEGDVVYSEQGFGYNGLSDFARWQDYRDRLPTFEVRENDDYDRHPLRAIVQNEPKMPTYLQTACHSFHTGYFLPIDFERVIFVEPFTIHNHWTFHHSVGSAPRLLTELNELGRMLGIDETWKWDATDPLARIKETFVQLLTVAKLSCEHDLPIIFHG